VLVAAFRWCTGQADRHSFGIFTPRECRAPRAMTTIAWCCSRRAARTCKGAADGPTDGTAGRLWSEYTRSYEEPKVVKASLSGEPEVDWMIYSSPKTTAFGITSKPLQEVRKELEEETA
jgi:hypothetical protein